jgi:hypothetical protein
MARGNACQRFATSPISSLSSTPAPTSASTAAPAASISAFITASSYCTAKPPAMITFNLNLEFGGYGTTYTAELARWPTWPVDANVIVKLAPLALELKVVFEIQGFKMEFTFVKL